VLSAIAGVVEGGAGLAVLDPWVVGSVELDREGRRRGRERRDCILKKRSYSLVQYLSSSLCGVPRRTSQVLYVYRLKDFSFEMRPSSVRWENNVEYSAYLSQEEREEGEAGSLLVEEQSAAGRKKVQCVGIIPFRRYIMSSRFAEMVSSQSVTGKNCGVCCN
jgi:hypothetical protein